MENKEKKLSEAQIGDKVYWFNLLFANEGVRFSKVMKVGHFQDSKTVRLYLNNGDVIHPFDTETARTPTIKSLRIYAADKAYLVAYVKELLQDNINTLKKEKEYEYA